MKPYVRCLYNIVKLNVISVSSSRKLVIGGMPLLGYATKIHLDRNAYFFLGNKVSNDGRLSIVVSRGAELSIGNNTYFNEDCMISVKSQVTIGSNCKFGPGVKIFDNNHFFKRESGVSGKCVAAPIIIGENSWVGANCVILKGVSIGRNCVIGAGCVIRENIPDYSIVTLEHNLKIREMKD